MGPAWEILLAHGLPDGAARQSPSIPLDDRAVREAASALFSHLDEIPAARRDPLLAWLRAFQHHWPARFRDLLGSAGEAAADRLAELGPDPNRYLKLRRIAIENLAGIV